MTKAFDKIMASLDDVKAGRFTVAITGGDDAKLKRVTEIDAMFEAAAGWGSWMVMSANEREWLVTELRSKGHDIEHKWLARDGSGGRVS